MNILKFKLQKTLWVDQCKLGLIVFLVFLCASLFSDEVNAQHHKFVDQLAAAAIALTDQEVIYDPTYFSIPYPNGDVPADKGVCTDVVIRAYRLLDIDLQKEVHEDMKTNFTAYPNLWGLKRTDTNIDHRRVPNLMKFFSRHGEEIRVSKNGRDYKPGDIVCWSLGGGKTHIGIVSNQKNQTDNRYKMVHNIGTGQILEDCLFDYKIIGHYRYNPQAY